MPKQCGRRSDHNGKMCKAEPKGGTDGGWKRNMKLGTDHAIEDKGDAVNETTNNGAIDCLAPELEVNSNYVS